MKLLFATYGTLPKYKPALERIHNQAKEFEMFDRILPFSQHDLTSDFSKKHGGFMNSNTRGNGYWIWKPQVILQAFETMNDGDVLVYADAGCFLNSQGKPRLLDYIEMALEHDLMIFTTCNAEKTWNKQDVLAKFPGVDRDSGQLGGGIHVWKKNARNTDLLLQWLELASDYHNIDDSASVSANDVSFKEHRHDQSLLSLVVKRAGYARIIPNDAGRTPWVDNMHFPIQARRSRNE